MVISRNAYPGSALYDQAAPNLTRRWILKAAGGAPPPSAAFSFKAKLLVSLLVSPLPLIAHDDAGHPGWRALTTHGCLETQGADAKRILLDNQLGGPTRAIAPLDTPKARRAMKCSRDVWPSVALSAGPALPR